MLVTVGLATIGVCVFCAVASVAALFILRGDEMGLVKLKLPSFIKIMHHEEQLCDAAIYIDSYMVWSGLCNRTAVFEASENTNIGILIYNACVRYPIPFHQDIVITGIVSPNKQYEIAEIQNSFKIMEIHPE